MIKSNSKKSEFVVEDIGRSANIISKISPFANSPVLTSLTPKVP